ncbi:MAG TPA: hypothetical protein VMF09_16565 [Solirubrobacteraceae bacterium]|nr:hypothetical protein [Solirubrobacteraceae bacterium]
MRLATFKGTPVMLPGDAGTGVVIYFFPGDQCSADADGAQHRAFDRRRQDLEAYSVSAVGVSSENPRAQFLRVGENRIFHELWSDPDLLLGKALGVPTFAYQGRELYGRAMVVVLGGFGETGIISSSSPSYIPQLGLHLNSQELSGAAAQDPPNEYTANQPLAQPHQEGPENGPYPAPPSPVEAVAAPVLEEPPVNETEMTGFGAETDPRVLWWKAANELATTFLRWAGEIGTGMETWEEVYGDEGAIGLLNGDATDLRIAAEQLKSCATAVEKMKPWPGECYVDYATEEQGTLTLGFYHVLTLWERPEACPWMAGHEEKREDFYCRGQKDKVQVG